MGFDQLGTIVSIIIKQNHSCNLIEFIFKLYLVKINVAGDRVVDKDEERYYKNRLSFKLH